jgi:hypothetical protein
VTPLLCSSTKLEYDHLLDNQTWESVDWKIVPSGVPIHKPIWRFKIKMDGRYKAHLCSNGQYGNNHVAILMHFLSGLKLQMEVPAVFNSTNSIIM